MLVTNERKQQFFAVANAFVRKNFRKREVAKLNFTQKEIEDIKDLKKFLCDVLEDNREEMEKALDIGYKKYICVSVKVSIGEMFTFVNYFFDSKDLHYKDDLYIPKAIFNLGKNRHCEMFFCTSLLKATRNSYGYASPERKGDNALLSSVLFVDLDLPKALSTLDDDELMGIFFNEFGDLFNFLGGKVVKSGGGLHLYFGCSSLYFENPESLKKWKDLMSILNILFAQWGSDVKCNDKVRLLRVPYAVNRKAKYGKEGRQVKVLYDNFKVNDLQYLEQVIDYELTQGQLLASVLEDIVPTSNEVSVDEDFIWLGEIDLGIFDDEPKEYVPSEAVVSEHRRIEALAISNIKQKNSIIITRYDNKNSGYYNSYQGIQTIYDDIKGDKDYRIRDICFFLNNRSSSEGIRHITIWYLTYSFYNFLMVREYDDLKEKMQKINQQYFKPVMSDYEFEYYLSDCFNTMTKSKSRDKNIRNQIIKETYQPTEEEMMLVRGNYYTKGTKEYEYKEKKEHARRTREYRQRKQKLL